MASFYLNTLQTYLPLIGVNAVAIQLGTARCRLENETPSQKVDTGNWPLKNVFKTVLLVFGPSKASKQERAEAIQVFIDLQRNFLESVVPFTAMACGVALTVKSPSANASLAVQVFCVSRTLHNLLFVYPHQPFRAFSFVPQLLCQLVLAWEMFSSR
eukprot:CAMPEP_0185017520 /NCGR_PEP_ID=MMETSP1103-20130426/460_1 /TAXON_ID=36769 /ORGANISM="Paraphysomonas bandaiensis, Strain Caron Lab Isolate" /LENGTH=156 /DNA_ID=CAMNT_0027546967 /DNA_START=77 /DNA_END=547 /DNA_ORIENTATION=-